MQKPLIHSLLASPMSGDAIEARSFELIDQEVQRYRSPPLPSQPSPPQTPQLSQSQTPHSTGLHSPSPEPSATTNTCGFAQDEWQIVRRLVHTTGDLGILDAVRFSADAVSSAAAALRRGAPIVVDAQMVRAGLSLPRLRRAFPGYGTRDVFCHIADEDVAIEASRAGMPRSLYALRKARPVLDGGIVLFGNAPVALLELNRLILEEGVRPALVVGAPVGFVHVTESKDELMTLPVPWIAIAGRRGGSPLAVAALHALCELTAGQAIEDSGQPNRGAWADDPATEQAQAGDEAIILLGHGSRVPHAADPMYAAAHALKTRCGHDRVAVCFMSRLGPHLPETLAECIAKGARRIIVVPYFLHGGMHLKIDIPEQLRECAACHPGVRMVFAERLGYDDCFIDILERRIRAARSLPDIRELPVEPRERYPLPPGQEEFVPMSPEAAARWREELQGKEPC